jgi:hypothetical protein
MPPAQSLDHSRARYTEGTDSILKFGVIWWKPRLWLHLRYSVWIYSIFCNMKRGSCRYGSMIATVCDRFCSMSFQFGFDYNTIVITAYISKRQFSCFFWNFLIILVVTFGILGFIRQIWESHWEKCEVIWKRWPTDLFKPWQKQIDSVCQVIPT